MQTQPELQTQPEVQTQPKVQTQPELQTGTSGEQQSRGSHYHEQLSPGAPPCSSPPATEPQSGQQDPVSTRRSGSPANSMALVHPSPLPSSNAPSTPQGRQQDTFPSRLAQTQTSSQPQESAHHILLTDGHCCLSHGLETSHRDATGGVYINDGDRNTLLTSVPTSVIDQGGEIHTFSALGSDKGSDVKSLRADKGGATMRTLGGGNALPRTHTPSQIQKPACNGEKAREEKEAGRKKSTLGDSFVVAANAAGNALPLTTLAMPEMREYKGEVRNKPLDLLERNRDRAATVSTPAVETETALLQEGDGRGGAGGIVASLLGGFAGEEQRETALPATTHHQGLIHIGIKSSPALPAKDTDTTTGSVSDQDCSCHTLPQSPEERKGGGQPGPTGDTQTTDTERKREGVKEREESGLQAEEHTVTNASLSPLGVITGPHCWEDNSAATATGLEREGEETREERGGVSGKQVLVSRPTVTGLAGWVSSAGSQTCPPPVAATAVVSSPGSSTPQSLCGWGELILPSSTSISGSIISADESRFSPPLPLSLPLRQQDDRDSAHSPLPPSRLSTSAEGELGSLAQPLLLRQADSRDLDLRSALFPSSLCSEPAWSQDSANNTKRGSENRESADRSCPIQTLKSEEKRAILGLKDNSATESQRSSSNTARGTEKEDSTRLTQSQGGTESHVQKTEPSQTFVGELQQASVAATTTEAGGEPGPSKASALSSSSPVISALPPTVLQSQHRSAAEGSHPQQVHIVSQSDASLLRSVIPQSVLGPPTMAAIGVLQLHARDSVGGTRKLFFNKTLTADDESSAALNYVPASDPAAVLAHASLPPLKVHENLRHPVTEASFTSHNFLKPVTPPPRSQTPTQPSQVGDTLPSLTPADFQGESQQKTQAGMTGNEDGREKDLEKIVVTPCVSAVTGLISSPHGASEGLVVEEKPNSHPDSVVPTPLTRVPLQPSHDPIPNSEQVVIQPPRPPSSSLASRQKHLTGITSSEDVFQVFFEGESNFAGPVCGARCQCAVPGPGSLHTQPDSGSNANGDYMTPGTTVTTLTKPDEDQTIIQPSQPTSQLGQSDQSDNHDLPVASHMDSRDEVRQNPPSSRDRLSMDLAWVRNEGKEEADNKAESVLHVSKTVVLNQPFSDPLKGEEGCHSADFSSAAEAITDVKETIVAEANTDVKETIVAEANTDVKETTVAEANTDVKETTVAEANTDVKETIVAEANTDVKETIVAEANTDVKETIVAEANTDVKETIVAEANTDVKETTVAEANTDVKETTVAEANTDVREMTVALAKADVEETTVAIGTNEVEEKTVALVKAKAKVEENMLVLAKAEVEKNTMTLAKPEVLEKTVVLAKAKNEVQTVTRTEAELTKSNTLEVTAFNHLPSPSMSDHCEYPEPVMILKHPGPMLSHHEFINDYDVALPGVWDSDGRSHYDSVALPDHVLQEVTLAASVILDSEYKDYLRHRKDDEDEEEHEMGGSGDKEQLAEPGKDEISQKLPEKAFISESVFLNIPLQHDSTGLNNGSESVKRDLPLPSKPQASERLHSGTDTSSPANQSAELSATGSDYIIPLHAGDSGAEPKAKKPIRGNLFNSGESINDDMINVSPPLGPGQPISSQPLDINTAEKQGDKMKGNNTLVKRKEETKPNEKQNEEEHKTGDQFFPTSPEEKGQIEKQTQDNRQEIEEGEKQNQIIRLLQCNDTAKTAQAEDRQTTDRPPEPEEKQEYTAIKEEGHDRSGITGNGPEMPSPDSVFLDSTERGEGNDGDGCEVCPGADQNNGSEAVKGKEQGKVEGRERKSVRTSEEEEKAVSSSDPVQAPAGSEPRQDPRHSPSSSGSAQCLYAGMSTPATLTAETCEGTRDTSGPNSIQNAALNQSDSAFILKAFSWQKEQGPKHEKPGASTASEDGSCGCLASDRGRKTDNNTRTENLAASTLLPGVTEGAESTLGHLIQEENRTLSDSNYSAIDNEKSKEVHGVKAGESNGERDGERAGERDGERAGERDGERAGGRDGGSDGERAGGRAMPGLVVEVVTDSKSSDLKSMIWSVMGENHVEDKSQGSGLVARACQDQRSKTEAVENTTAPVESDPSQCETSLDCRASSSPSSQSHGPEEHSTHQNSFPPSLGHSVDTSQSLNQQSKLSPDHQATVTVNLNPDQVTDIAVKLARDSHPGDINANLLESECEPKETRLAHHTAIVGTSHSSETNTAVLEATDTTMTSMASHRVEQAALEAKPASDRDVSEEDMTALDRKREKKMRALAKRMEERKQKLKKAKEEKEGTHKISTNEAGETVSQATTEPQTVMSVTRPSTEPPTEMSVTGPTTEPQTEMLVTGPSTEPQTVMSVTGPSAAPQTVMSVTGPTKEPHTEMPVTGPTKEPQTEMSVTGPSSEPETDWLAALRSHAALLSQSTKQNTAESSEKTTPPRPFPTLKSLESPVAEFCTPSEEAPSPLGQGAAAAPSSQRKDSPEKGENPPEEPQGKEKVPEPDWGSSLTQTKQAEERSEPPPVTTSPPPTLRSAASPPTPRGHVSQIPPVLPTYLQEDFPTPPPTPPERLPPKPEPQTPLHALRQAPLAAPVQTPSSEPESARPVQTPSSEPGPARPVQTPSSEPGPARPVQTSSSEPEPARPVQTPSSEPGPVQTPSSESESARPVQTPSSEPGPARPVQTPSSEPESARPVQTPSSEPGPARPVQTPSSEPGPALSVQTPSSEPDPALSVQTPSSEPDPALSVQTPSTEPEPAQPFQTTPSESEPVLPVQTPSSEPEPALSVQTPSSEPDPALSVQTPSSEPEPALSVQTPSTEPEPAQPFQTTPSESEPVLTVQTQLSEPEPVRPVQTSPSESEPAQPFQTTPSESEPVLPVQTPSSEPARPVQTTTSEPEPAQLFQTTPSEPARPVQTLPSEPESVQPVQTSPSEPEPAQPVQSTPSESEPVIPVQTSPEPARPIQTTPSEPVLNSASPPLSVPPSPAPKNQEKDTTTFGFSDPQTDDPVSLTRPPVPGKDILTLAPCTADPTPRSSDSDGAFETPESTTPVKSPTQTDTVTHLLSSEDTGLGCDSVDDGELKAEAKGHHGSSLSIVFDEDKPIAASGAYNLDQLLAAAAAAEAQNRSPLTRSLSLQAGELDGSGPLHLGESSIASGDCPLAESFSIAGGTESAPGTLRRPSKKGPLRPGGSLKKKPVLRQNSNPETPQPTSSSTTPELKRKAKQTRADSPLLVSEDQEGGATAESAPGPASATPSPGGTLRRTRKPRVESPAPLIEETNHTSPETDNQPIPVHTPVPGPEISIPLRPEDIPLPVSEAVPSSEGSSPIPPIGAYKWDPDNFEDIDPFNTGGSKVANSPPLGRKGVANSPPLGRKGVANSPPLGRKGVANSPPLGRKGVATSPPLGRKGVATSPPLGRKEGTPPICRKTAAPLDSTEELAPPPTSPPIRTSGAVRLEFDYSEENLEEPAKASPASKKLGRKPGSKMPLRKPRLGLKKAVQLSSESLDNAPTIVPDDDIPIPKASYNFDPAQWEDPNFNPFGSNSGIPNSPKMNKPSYSFDSETYNESGVDPFKGSSNRRAASPPKAVSGSASFEVSANDNEVDNDNDDIGDLGDHNQNKPAKPKKKPIKSKSMGSSLCCLLCTDSEREHSPSRENCLDRQQSNTFRVKRSPKRCDSSSQDPTPVDEAPPPIPVPQHDHATDEEKLASSSSHKEKLASANHKWAHTACQDMEAELTSDPKEDLPLPSDLTSFVNENSRASDYEIEYMEKIGSSSPPLSVKKPSNLYLKLDSVTGSLNKPNHGSEPDSPCTGSFEEMEAQITAQMKTPVLCSRPGPEGSRPGPEGSAGDQEKTRMKEIQSVSRTQSAEREHGGGSVEVLVPDTPVLDRLSEGDVSLQYLEPDLAETNPSAFALKLQEELVLAAVRIEALQVAKHLSDSPSLSTVTPQKPRSRRWNLFSSPKQREKEVMLSTVDRDSVVTKGSLYTRPAGCGEGGRESSYMPKDLDHSLDIAREEVLSKEKEVQEWQRKYEDSRQEVLEMRGIVAEYEKTIAQMIAGLPEDEQKDKSLSHHTIQQLIIEKDQALSDLNSVEKSLAELFRRYEKLKDVLEGYRKNEEVLKKCAQEYLSRVRKEEQRYQALKIHAEEKLDKANADIAQVRLKARQEAAAYQASLRKETMKVDSLERTLEQKNKEIEELTKICDELIAKMGKS
ncbi:uncharacterized protein tacc2 isoform X8 [Esox lucius]|uniref:uncharacterized protein tacc2 isoform X8 n=1 Tax=Esox lucius TaxID=8010 RepID=UPI0014769946|nr:uncharacterized protein tacc2 isoform X8 [Esox lucius]